MTLIDPIGLDIWTEGPSGDEPDFHQSINVGDPHGEYDSYSFGGNVPPTIPTGSTYTDEDQGGEVLRFMETTPEQDLQAKIALDAANFQYGWYGPGNTCIDHANDTFDEFKERFGTSESTPPDRDPAPRTWLGRARNPYVTTTTTTTTTTGN